MAAAWRANYELGVQVCYCYRYVHLNPKSSFSNLCRHALQDVVNIVVFGVHAAMV